MSLVRVAPTKKRPSLLTRLFPGHGKHRRNPLLDENLRLRAQLAEAEAAVARTEAQLAVLTVRYEGARTEVVRLTDALRVSMAAHEANAHAIDVPMWVRPGTNETTLTMPIPADRVEIVQPVQPVKPVRTPKARGTAYMTLTQGEFHKHLFTHPSEVRPEARHAGITVVRTLHAAMGATDIPDVLPVAP